MSEDTAPVPNVTKERRGPHPLVIALGVAIAIVAVIGGVLAYFYFTAVAEVDDVEVVLEDFLKATSADDLDRAYGLFSEEAQDATSLAAFKEGVPDQAAFHTFQRLERGGWKKSFETGRPTVFAYTGTVWHTNGDRDDFYAELVKGDGRWKIKYIEVQ